MNFDKGVNIDNLFKKLEKIIDNNGKKAEKRVLYIYDNANIKPTSARNMMNVIVEECKLECGCCYKLSKPAIDIIMSELTMLQYIVDEVENICKKENNDKVLKILDHNKRIMQVMIVGLRELGVTDLYDKTMDIYAMTYHLANPGNKKENFDHIIGMEEAIQKTIREHKDKTTNDVRNSSEARDKI